MRLALVISGLATVLALTQSATAADLPMYTKAPAAPAYYSWTGFYVGAHLGGAWSDTTISSADRVLMNTFYGGVPEPRGIIGGGQIGYNYQLPNNFVLGVEVAGGGGPGFSDRVSIPGVSEARSEGEWYTMAGGRLGYAMDRWLPYVVGGGAWGGNKAFSTFGGNFRNTHEGYFIGGGVEYGLSQNITVGIDYRYLDLEKKVYGSVTTGSEISAVVGRLNYRF